MIGLNDILFYWDHAHKTLAPVVGGAPVFSRLGNAHYLQPDGRFAKALGDTPRFEPEGLLLEQFGLNRLSNPMLFDNTASPWAGNGDYTIEEVEGIFPDYSGWKHRNTNTDAQRVQALPFSLSSGRTDLFSVIFESVDAVDSQFHIFRTSPSSGAVARIGYNWSTGVLTLHQQENIAIYGHEVLTETGPNGGRVVFIWLAVRPTTSGAGEIYLFPDGLGQHQNAGILHYAEMTLGSLYPSTPVDGSRPAEGFYWKGAPSPRAMAIYCRYKIRTAETFGSRVLSIDPLASNQSRVFISENSSDDSTSFHFENGTNPATSAKAVHGPLVRGDVIELAGVLKADGSLRMVVRKNETALSSGTASAPAAGLPTNWANSNIDLNEIGGFLKGWRLFQQIKFVALDGVQSQTDGSEDNELINELAGLSLSADRQRISNVVPA